MLIESGLACLPAKFPHLLPENASGGGYRHWRKAPVDQSSTRRVQNNGTKQMSPSSRRQFIVLQKHFICTVLETSEHVYSVVRPGAASVSLCSNECPTWYLMERRPNDWAATLVDATLLVRRARRLRVAARSGTDYVALGIQPGRKMLAVV